MLLKEQENTLFIYFCQQIFIDHFANFGLTEFNLQCILAALLQSCLSILSTSPRLSVHSFSSPLKPLIPSPISSLSDWSITNFCQKKNI